METDGGVTGYGLDGTDSPPAARELINREIAPLLIGKDPLATERHWYDQLLKLGRRPAPGPCGERSGYRAVGYKR